MSNEAITWAFKQSLPMNEKFVLVSLADYADENHSCFPSMKKTAERVGCSDRTVRTLVSKLEQRGYLTVHKREHPNGGSSTNRYVLNVGDEDFSPPVVSNRRGVKQASVGGGNGFHEGGETVFSTVTLNEPLNEPLEEPSSSRKRDGAGYTPDFLNFWEAYPLKRDKGAAFKAWKKLNTAEHTAVMAGVHRYANDPNREKRYTKYPASWLNARAWEDETPLPARTEKKQAWQVRQETYAAERARFAQMDAQLAAQSDWREIERRRNS